ncbi:SHOCT domain-containing protein [Nocardioides marmorisolisilvae]|uniref:SHOCT domain-containing protein n=1 Tax=Nocardioides marmorisolisilvae TaxID=1542737 RepID=A0A3N0E0Q0_9ACTN|nr:SHOCT domain-containing protein [Nocardioides marmorisolisilvae]RNL81437.1 SHOCT domain-containing protein [Nocardioides marmorisolisilvae]
MTFLGSVRLAVVALLCTVTLGLAPAATAASSEACFDGTSGSFDDGCTIDATDSGFDGGTGIPSGFIVLFVLVALGGVAATIWRVSTARRLAEQAGLDPNLAGRVALMDEDGLSAAYVASSLRQQQGAAPPPSASASDRLAELKGMLDKGLITQAEHDERRKAIIDSV